MNFQICEDTKVLVFYLFQWCEGILLCAHQGCFQRSMEVFITFYGFCVMYPSNAMLLQSIHPWANRVGHYGMWNDSWVMNLCSWGRGSGADQYTGFYGSIGLLGFLDDLKSTQDKTKQDKILQKQTVILRLLLLAAAWSEFFCFELHLATAGTEWLKDSLVFGAVSENTRRENWGAATAKPLLVCKCHLCVVYWKVNNDVSPRIHLSVHIAFVVKEMSIEIGGKSINLHIFPLWWLYHMVCKT